MSEENLNQVENEALDKMARGLRKIWEIIIFCCVGWLLVTIGMKLNPFIALIGALVIAIPSVISVRRHGIKNIFNYDYQIVTTYRDGRKTYDADLGGKMGMLVIQIIGTILLGVILTPIRYVAYCIQFSANCKKLDWKPELKEGIWLPTIVGVAVFVLGIILANII